MILLEVRGGVYLFAAETETDVIDALRNGKSILSSVETAENREKPVYTVHLDDRRILAIPTDMMNALLSSGKVRRSMEVYSLVSEDTISIAVAAMEWPEYMPG